MQLKETPDGETVVELSKPERDTLRKAQKLLGMAAKGISDEGAKAETQKPPTWSGASCTPSAMTLLP